MSTVTSVRGVEISGEFKYMTFRGRTYRLVARYVKPLEGRLLQSDSESGPWEEAEEVKK